MLEGLGFNSCVAPFLNIRVPNFELECIGWRWLELVREVPQGVDREELVGED